MWKPGSDKPAPASSAEKKTSKETPDSAKRRKTELSGVTRNMRFMQRGRTPPESVKQKKGETAPMEVETDRRADPDDETTNMNTSSMETSEEDTDFVATPTEMYGIEGSVALGRRSFGGFNTVVAENWFRQKQEIFPKPHKGSAKEDRKLLKQFDQMEREEEQRNRRGKKKRMNGISNGNNKRTKTLEEILAMTSP